MFKDRDSVIICKFGLISLLCELFIIGRFMGGFLEGGDCFDCLLIMVLGEG